MHSEVVWQIIDQIARWICQGKIVLVLVCVGGTTAARPHDSVVAEGIIRSDVYTCPSGAIGGAGKTRRAQTRPWVWCRECYHTACSHWLVGIVRHQLHSQRVTEGGIDRSGLVVATQVPSVKPCDSNAPISQTSPLMRGKPS